MTELHARPRAGHRRARALLGFLLALACAALPAFAQDSPAARSLAASCAACHGTDGRRIYVAGGEVTTKQLVGAFRGIEAYEPATNSWIALPSMPMPRHGVAGAVIAIVFGLLSTGDRRAQRAVPSA